MLLTLLFPDPFIPRSNPLRHVIASVIFASYNEAFPIHNNQYKKLTKLEIVPQTKEELRKYTTINH